MPLTAMRSLNPREELVANNGMPEVVSSSGRELSESYKNSIREFSRLEVKRHDVPSYTVVIFSTSRKPLRETLFKVHNLLSWGPNWNSYNALAPNPNAVAHAESWIVSLFQTILNVGLPWIKPNTTASPEGEVAFEWRNGEKKLTVYVGDGSADYMQVWGTDIHAKISDGDAEPINNFLQLWGWLVS